MSRHDHYQCERLYWRIGEACTSVHSRTAKRLPILSTYKLAGPDDTVFHVNEGSLSLCCRQHFANVMIATYNQLLHWDKGHELSDRAHQGMHEADTCRHPPVLLAAHHRKETAAAAAAYHKAYQNTQGEVALMGNKHLIIVC